MELMITFISMVYHNYDDCEKDDIMDVHIILLLYI